MDTEIGPLGNLFDLTEYTDHHIVVVTETYTQWSALEITSTQRKIL